MKRSVYSFNVDSKQRKLGQEMACLQDKKDKLKFKSELADHIEEIKKDPRKLPKARLGANLDTASSHDKSKDFNPTSACKTLSEAPPTHLNDVFFPKAGMRAEDMKNWSCRTEVWPTRCSTDSLSCSMQPQIDDF